MPTTRKTDFDPMTLWALKERKQKLKTIQEASRPDIPDEELTEPIVKEKSVNNVGDMVL